MKKWKRKVDNRMRWQGETDTDKKVIKINKKKSKKKTSIIDTIAHEEMHVKHPKMHEKTVYKKTKHKVKSLSRKSKQRLYSKYKR